MGEPFGDTFVRAINAGSLSVFATILFLSLVIGGLVVVVSLLAGVIERKSVAQSLALLICLALFGAIAGYAGGLSREAAVGEIIPAVLGLAGGLATYLFGIDTSRGAVASVALAAFTVALFFGYAFGSDVRVDNEINSEKREACYRLFYDPSLYAEEGGLGRAAGAGNATLIDCKRYWP